MSLRDDSFFHAFLEPRGPNEKLKAMWARYREIQDMRARAEALYENELAELRAALSKGDEK